MDKVTISAPRSYTVRGWPAVSATFGIEGRSIEVFYRASQGPLSTNTDMFLAAALLPAMRIGAPIHLAAPLSPLVRARTARLQELMSAWSSHLHRAPVEADPLTNPPEAMEWPGTRGAGCFFSGGVDSFHSALTLHDHLTHLIFVHGIDISLRDQAFRHAVVGTLHEAANELGKPLIEVETNVRDLLDHYIDWAREGAGPALASVALLLTPQLHTVYCAGGAAYQNLPSSGFHPLVTDLLSTHDIEIVQSGRAETRYEKVAYLATSDIALRYLRVCWEHPGGAYNCGQCPKCLHTMVDLHMEGALQRCRTFNRPLDLKAVRDSRLHGGSERGFFAEALAVAERRGDDPALTQALRDCVGDVTANMSDEELRDGLRKAETRLTSLELALQRERKRTDRLRQRLRKVLSSRSWKLTAPARALGRLARLRKGKNR